MSLTQEQESELYRELNTMERNDLIDLSISYMSDKEKVEFMKGWKQS